MIYDSVIIGTGPAGLSAALNLKIHNKNFLWIGSPNFSEKIVKAEKIANYPGLIHVSGREMADTFRAQADAMGLEIKDAMVNSIISFGTHYALMAGSEFFEAKTVILATGVATVGTLPGETEKMGLGISYCATCDGGLYRGKTIAVICGNKRFEHEVVFLSELAETVYLFPMYSEIGSFADNVIISSQRPIAIEGACKVERVACKDGSSIAVDGVFCLRDAISLGTLLPGLKTDNGHIAVNRQMATNLPGVFAAGDCTGRPYQYVKAAGEGNVAAHSVIAYLSEK